MSKLLLSELQKICADVYNVKEDRESVMNGIPSTKYDIFTKHPVTGTRWVHTFELSKETLRTADVPKIFESYLKDWWKDIG